MKAHLWSGLGPIYQYTISKLYVALQAGKGYSLHIGWGGRCLFLAWWLPAGWVMGTTGKRRGISWGS